MKTTIIILICLGISAGASAYDGRMMSCTKKGITVYGNYTVDQIKEFSNFCERFFPATIDGDGPPDGYVLKWAKDQSIGLDRIKKALELSMTWLSHYNVMSTVDKPAFLMSLLEIEDQGKMITKEMIQKALDKLNLMIEDFDYIQETYNEIVKQQEEPKQ